jgi:Helix-turn-helix domain
MEHRADPLRHRRAFGRELRTWYERRGVSLRRLGDLIPCSFALIHHAAQGREWPSPWFVVRADWCLGADGRLVDAFVDCWLREELEHIVLGTEPAARAETMAAEQCREIIGVCRRLDDLGMSAAVVEVGRRPHTGGRARP